MSGAARDAGLTIGLVLAFAALITVHLATLFGLTQRRHMKAALVSLVVPPLAPYWAFTQGMRARAIAWVASAALYVVAFVLAR